MRLFDRSVGAEPDRAGVMRDSLFLFIMISL